jgi:hypothetical protein
VAASRRYRSGFCTKSSIQTNLYGLFAKPFSELVFSASWRLGVLALKPT